MTASASNTADVKAARSRSAPNPVEDGARLGTDDAVVDELGASLSKRAQIFAQQEERLSRADDPEFTSPDGALDDISVDGRSVSAPTIGDHPLAPFTRDNRVLTGHERVPQLRAAETSSADGQRLVFHAEDSLQRIAG